MCECEELYLFLSHLPAEYVPFVPCLLDALHSAKFNYFGAVEPLLTFNICCIKDEFDLLAQFLNSFNSIKMELFQEKCHLEQ